MADFGLSRKIAEASNTSNICGVLPYIDPKSFNKGNQSDNKSEHYKLNPKSDIYSIGVIMWQISSGRRPFEDRARDIGLALAIYLGEREKIVDGTPPEYSNLYTSKLY